MLPLILEKTQDTPEIILDKQGNKFSFTGNSVPEDVHGFYNPILDWVKAYSENPNDETVVLFKMTYFNTASTKSLHDIIKAFKKISKNGNMLIINWFVADEDEDMYIGGKELSELVKLPFNFTKY